MFVGFIRVYRVQGFTWFIGFIGFVLNKATVLHANKLLTSHAKGIESPCMATCYMNPNLASCPSSCAGVAITAAEGFEGFLCHSVLNPPQEVDMKRFRASTLNAKP